MKEELIHMKKKGLFEQIQDSNNVLKYKSITTSDLDNFILDLKESNHHVHSGSIFHTSELMLKYIDATISNNKGEIEFCLKEIEKRKLQKYKSIASLLGFSPEFIKELCEHYRHKNRYTWIIEDKYLGDHEYIEDSEYTQLKWEDNKFTLETWFTDGYYDNKLLNKEELTKEQVLERYSKSDNIT